MLRWLQVPACLTLRQGRTPAQTRATPKCRAWPCSPPQHHLPVCHGQALPGQGRAEQQGWHSPEGTALEEEIRQHESRPGGPPRQSHCSLTACHAFNFLWLLLASS